MSTIPTIFRVIADLIGIGVSSAGSRPRVTPDLEKSINRNVTNMRNQQLRTQAYNKISKDYQEKRITGDEMKRLYKEVDERYPVR